MQDSIMLIAETVIITIIKLELNLTSKNLQHAQLVIRNGKAVDTVDHTATAAQNVFNPMFSKTVITQIPANHATSTCLTVLGATQSTTAFKHSLNRQL